jgi:hypothetical protein
MYVKTRGLEADAAGVAPDRPRTTKPTDRSGRMSWDAVAPEAASAQSVKATRTDAWRESSPTHVLTTSQFPERCPFAVAGQTTSIRERVRPAGKGDGGDENIIILVETLPKLRFLWSLHLFGHHTILRVGPA